MPLVVDLDEEPLNTTPMIDVVFNLLVFFMLTATFLAEETGLPVNLPRVPKAAPLTPAPQEIVVDVLQDGRLAVGGKPRSRTELEALLKAACRNFPDQAVAVRGHRSARYEAVVQVFALARAAGVTRVVARVREDRSP